jgi:hypothetical protein
LLFLGVYGETGPFIALDCGFSDSGGTLSFIFDVLFVVV